MNVETLCKCSASIAARCCFDSACELSVGFLYLTAGSLLNTLPLFCSFLVLCLRHKRQNIPLPSTYASHHIAVLEQYERDLSVSHSCLNLSFKDFWAFWSFVEIVWHEAAGLQFFKELLRFWLVTFSLLRNSLRLDCIMYFDKFISGICTSRSSRTSGSFRIRPNSGCCCWFLS